MRYTDLFITKPDLYISKNKNGTKWTIKTEWSIIETKISATEGVEFDEVTEYGRQFKSLLTNKDGKLIIVQKDASTGNVWSTIVRELINDHLVMTCKVGNVVCKRYFKRKI